MDLFLKTAIEEAWTGLPRVGVSIGPVLGHEGKTEFIAKNPGLWNEDIGRKQ